MMGRCYPGYWVVFRQETDWVQFEVVYKNGDKEYVSDKLEYFNYGDAFVKTPAAPKDLKYNEETGCISFIIDPVDVEDTAINTDKLYWRLYIDDELYVFTPSEYLFLFDYEEDADPVDLLPYYVLTWDNIADDWWGNYDSFTIYLHPSERFSSIGVEAVYINGDEIRVSSRTTLTTSGIDQSWINDDMESEYYTVDGKFIGIFYKSDEKNLNKGTYIKRHNGKATKFIK